MLSPCPVIGVNPDCLVAPAPFDYLRILRSLCSKGGRYIYEIVPNQLQGTRNCRDQ